MKPVCFDVFEYIEDEIWNIVTNPLRSCSFAPYIQFMIEFVAQEKFYKDVRHDPLRPAMPRDPRASRVSFSTAPAAARLALPAVVVPPPLLLPTSAS
jgi:hypothetical protein